jgi:outer membrane protein assembly factor BamE
MYKVIVFFLLAALSFLSACSAFRPYQPDVQQGNLITPRSIGSLQLGMSKQQVESIMGYPILADNFNDNHWAYVYTFQHSGGSITKKRVDLYFQNDSLARIEKRGRF